MMESPLDWIHAMRRQTLSSLINISFSCHAGLRCMQSLHQIPIPPQTDNYSLRINDDLFSSQTPGQAAGGVPQLWQLHGGHPEGHPRGPPQVRADHNIIMMWWPHVMTPGTGVRAPWWRVSTRARAAPSGAPTRRSGNTRPSAASRRRVSAQMFLYFFEPKIIENEYARSRASKPDLQDSEPKEHSRTPCTLCYIQYRKRLVYILIESRTSIEHGNSRRMNWIWI